MKFRFTAKHIANIQKNAAGLSTVQDKREFIAKELNALLEAEEAKAGELRFTSMSEGKRLLYTFKKNNEALRAQLAEAMEVIKEFTEFCDDHSENARACLEKYPK